jgi:hypothetical protein
MKMNPRFLLRLAAILFALSLLPAGLFGEEEPTVFLVLTRSLERVSEPEFQRLIDGYMKFELQHRRLAAWTEADLPEAAPDWPKGEASAREVQKAVLRSGRKAKADFVLLCSYQRKQPEVELRLDCYELAGDGLVSSEAADATLALVLDRAVTQLVERTLEVIGPRLVYLPYVPEGTAPPSEEPAAPSTPRPREGPLPPTPFPPVEQVVHPLEVSLCLSPLFAIGEAAGYFRIGFFPSINGSYRLYTRAGHLSLGASLGSLMFFAQSTSTDARGYLIPLAATIGFHRPFPDSRLAFHLRLASGPALFLLDPLSSSAQTKILAFLGTGIGVEYALSAAWGVRLQLDYSIFFEKDQPIMGYAPGLYAFYRF